MCLCLRSLWTCLRAVCVYIRATANDPPVERPLVTVRMSQSFCTMAFINIASHIIYIHIMYILYIVQNKKCEICVIMWIYMVIECRRYMS